MTNGDRYTDAVVREILTISATREDTRENASYVSGLERALALYMGSDEARQYLSANGIAI
jgi:hypothetical protein